MKWHSAAALQLLVGISGCAGSRRVQHPPWDRQQGRGVPAQAVPGSSQLRQPKGAGLHPTFSPSSPARFQPGKDIFADGSPGNRAGHHLQETKPRFWSVAGERARGPAQPWKGTPPTFRTNISPPVGQSSPALLLAVLLGEERSALLMAMNSSRLFIQPSSACWLQPQPAPPHGMTPPGNNAPPGNGPLRPRTLRDTSAAAALSSSPRTPRSILCLQQNGLHPAQPRSVTPREQR